MEKNDEVLTGEVYENVYIAEAASSCEKNTGYRSKYRKSDEKIYPFREGHEYIKNPNYVQGIVFPNGFNPPPPTPMYYGTDHACRNFATEEILRAQQQCCTMDRVHNEYQQYQMNQNISNCPGYTPKT